MDVFKVIEPGLFTTVQDLGRYGSQQFGVPAAGALDGFSCRAANLLVGNPEVAAVLEMTFMGARLEVLAPAMVAVCGAEMPVLVNKKPQATWASFAVQAGDVLALPAAKKGIRSYLAVSGGIDVPLVMGSRCTYVGAHLGGQQGRPLLKGDVLRCLETGPLPGVREVPVKARPRMGGDQTLRSLPGPQDDFFDSGLEVFFGSTYKVSSQTDRMGCRLEGAVVDLKPDAPKSIISEPSVPGGVQIPANGQPIILLVEQTVGGYAKIATVVSADLDKVAQLRPGEKVQFQKIDLDSARNLYKERQQQLESLKELLSG
ncbi:MAG: biotin-dependent carboxyltransferase family protein [Desulfarculaceae bacterium]|jgi:biotin-dependent carboxylase-like uncharacterized protein